MASDRRQDQLASVAWFLAVTGAVMTDAAKPPPWYWKGAGACRALRNQLVKGSSMDHDTGRESYCQVSYALF